LELVVGECAVVGAGGVVFGLFGIVFDSLWDWYIICE